MWRTCRCFLPPNSHTWKGTKGHGHPTRLFSGTTRWPGPLYRIPCPTGSLTMRITITAHLFNPGWDALAIKAPVTLMAVIIKTPLWNTASLPLFGSAQILLLKSSWSHRNWSHFSSAIMQLYRTCITLQIRYQLLQYLTAFMSVTNRASGNTSNIFCLSILYFTFTLKVLLVKQCY